jgi:hypothetical protein
MAVYRPPTQAQSNSIDRSTGSAEEVTDDRHGLDGYRQDVGMALMKKTTRFGGFFYGCVF